MHSIWRSCFTKNYMARVRAVPQRRVCTVVPVETFEDVCFVNEPILEYKVDSPERNKLEDALDCAIYKCEEIPIVINGKEFVTDEERFQIMPSKHSKQIAKFYYAEKKHIHKAIKAATIAQEKWDKTTLKDRISIWERAANLMAKTYRADLVAKTMLGQSKTIIQAEIDAAAELIDFIRMNTAFLKQAANYQPISDNCEITRNHMRFRGIDGFIAAISPFNFTAIGGNLAYTPALMGNAVVWKPSDSAMLSNWQIFKIMREAGVPDGVVNFVPCDGPTFGEVITSSPQLAGINFTGSVPTFQALWKLVGANIETYNNFPRLIGECGGKNFHFAHQTADDETVVAATIRSAFEYSGQKCSACSRLYVPETLWKCKIKEPLIAKVNELKVGDVMYMENFTSAVIDERAFQRIVGYIEYAKGCDNVEVAAGGKYNNMKGYYVDPTVLIVKDPDDRLMKEEIFGPVLSVYVYKDTDVDRTMDLVVNSTKYALTGAVFAQDEKFLKKALKKFKVAAGNFYINDKSTGSIVGQQPFGGGRLSGTNDKAGGPHYILRWTSPQSIKETYVPMTDIFYPYMNPCPENTSTKASN